MRQHEINTEFCLVLLMNIALLRSMEPPHCFFLSESSKVKVATSFASFTGAGVASVSLFSGVCHQ